MELTDDFAVLRQEIRKNIDDNKRFLSRIREEEFPEEGEDSGTTGEEES
jgi:hypothetical protein